MYDKDACIAWGGVVWRALRGIQQQYQSVSVDKRFVLDWGKRMTYLALQMHFWLGNLYESTMGTYSACTQWTINKAHSMFNFKEIMRQQLKQ